MDNKEELSELAEQHLQGLTTVTEFVFKVFELNYHVALINLHSGTILFNKELPDDQLLQITFNPKRGFTEQVFDNSLVTICSN